MGILDDAIREHLELKRQHGAGESELEQLEGEAFGPPERPGSGEAESNALAEAPTEFMAKPEAVEGQDSEAIDAQEPSAPTDSKAPEAAEQTRSRPESAPEIADLQEAPEPEPDEPAEEEAPAMEHEAIPEPEPAVSQEGPSTEERQAIADPPTELYDVEGEEFDSKPQAPSDDELIEEEEIGEPRLAPAPADSLAAIEGTGADEEQDEPDLTVAEAADEDEDDFFDEKRLSDELDQALDAPLEAPQEEPEPEPDEERELEESPATRSEEDVLEETPDFLEEAPEDDQLWFEQKPPKDFDFDD